MQICVNPVVTNADDGVKHKHNLFNIFVEGSFLIRGEMERAFTGIPGNPSES